MAPNIPAMPRGIEVLVKKAAVDADFRESLLAKRAAAADEIGLTLTPAEVAMLNAVPARQIELIIGQTRVDPAVRPAFLGKVAAAMLMAIGVMTIATGEGDAQISKGIQPDTPQPPTTQQAQPVDIAGMTVGRVPPLEVQPKSGVRVAPPVIRPTHGVRPDMPPTSQPATQPTTQPAALAPGEFDKLVKQLDDRDFKVREAAEDRLVAAGKGILPLLRKTLLENKDLAPEASWRISRAISRLDPPATTPQQEPPVVVFGVRIESVKGLRADQPPVED